MHIPDGFISGSVNMAAGVAAVTAVGFSVRRVTHEVQRRPEMVPLLATTAAFVFAAQMLNFPILGGTSGHFLGAATVAALLGPASSCLVMTLVLLIQCLLFNDGGLTALGTNFLNMGIIGGVGAYLVMRPLRALLPTGRGGYLAAVSIASWASVMMAAGACAVELAISGTSPLLLVLPAMLGTHAVIGIGEALITAAILSAVVAARPDILPGWAAIEVGSGDSTPPRRRVWPLAGAGMAIAIALALLVSPFASGCPDGLEKVAEDQEFLEAAEGRQVWHKSPLPDYSVTAIASEGPSTGVAGLLGTVAMFAVGFSAIKLLGACSQTDSQPDVSLCQRRSQGGEQEVGSAQPVTRRSHLPEKSTPEKSTQ